MKFYLSDITKLKPCSIINFTLMKARLFLSEAKFLERARTALVNVRNHPEIKAAMADFGMDESKLAEGDATYHQARSMKELSDRETKESRLASNAYQEAFEEFQALFKRHLDFVRIFFKDDLQMLINMGVQGKFPRKYTEVFDRAKAFYSTAQMDPNLQQQLSQIKITSEVVAERLSKLEELLAARSYFDKEMGESQQVTQSKNLALLKLKDWMDNFDATAKVALYDKPQLMEALGIFVRS